MEGTAGRHAGTEWRVAAGNFPARATFLSAPSAGPGHRGHAEAAGRSLWQDHSERVLRNESGQEADQVGIFRHKDFKFDLSKMESHWQF